MGGFHRGRASAHDALAGSALGLSGVLELVEHGGDIGLGAFTPAGYCGFAALGDGVGHSVQTIMLRQFRARRAGFQAVAPVRHVRRLAPLR